MCSFVMEGSKGTVDLIDLKVNFWLFDREMSGKVQVKNIFFIKKICHIEKIIIHLRA